MTFCQTILIELFKIILFGGLLLLFKALITRYFNKRDNERRINELRNQFRTDIIDSFINNFSALDEIRKLYHSTFIEENHALDLEAKKEMVIKCLLNSTKQEGEFGAIKVKIINHYKLNKGNWETKDIEKLRIKIKAQIGKKNILRYKLDLLGEYYDKWRNSIEDGIKIPLDGDIDFYNLYTEILTELELLNLKSPVEQKNGSK